MEAAFSETSITITNLRNYYIPENLTFFLSAVSNDFFCLFSTSVRSFDVLSSCLRLSFIVSVKVKQSRYSPEVPRGLQEVKVPRLRDNGPGWW